MMHFLRFLVPVRIGSQIASLVVAALLLANVVATAVFFLVDPRLPLPRDRVDVGERLGFLVRILDGEPDAAARSTVIAAARRVEPSLQVLDSAPAADPAAVDSFIAKDLQRRLGDEAGVVVSRPSDQPANGQHYSVAARLSDGSFIALPVPAPAGKPPFISPPIIAMLAFLASAVALLSLWAAHQLTAPLARLADAAERFTMNTSTAPLVESGPLEVRRTAKALNNMQQRVLKLVADRTRMLAAIGHDLRTPITRLRLRTEEIGPESLRVQFLRDLTIMQNLVQSALAFLRGQFAPERKVTTDLAALVQTVCDDFVDAEGHVWCRDLPRVYIDCEPDQLMRAIGNLIDNGLKFGVAVNVSVVHEGNGMVAIEIQDEGPGIPDAEKLRAVEPFYRGDAARDLSAGDSFGLGLSIAQTIVERNGGTLDLRDGRPRGLLARIVLPVADGAVTGSRSSGC
jgi:signal transduction histidine kinase